MNSEKVVTIWHFSDSDAPVIKIFKNASIDTALRIKKNGIKQKGFFDGTSSAVRIFTKDEIGILPGDYLYMGECHNQNLPIENALKILEVKDNRRGGQKHWRIVCGG